MMTVVCRERRLCRYTNHCIFQDSCVIRSESSAGSKPYGARKLSDDLLWISSYELRPNSVNICLFKFLHESTVYVYYKSTRSYGKDVYGNRYQIMNHSLTSQAIWVLSAVLMNRRWYYNSKGANTADKKQISFFLHWFWLLFSVRLYAKQQIIFNCLM